MKLKIKIAFGVLLIATLFIGLSPYSVQGSIADIHYTFENDIAYSKSGNINWSNSFNMRNKTTYMGHYNATYSFENDIDGTAPSGWTEVDTGTTTSRVIASLDGHEKVVNFNDDDAAGRCYIYRIIAQGPNEDIEFWIRTSDNTKKFYIYFYEGGDRIINMYIEAGKLKNANGGVTNIVDITDDTWYHVRLDLDDDAEDYDCYVNGVLEGTLDFENPSFITLNTIWLLSEVAHSGYNVYFDALGLSVDTDYYVGLNVIPYYEIDYNVKEIDAYEFGWLAQNQLYAIGWNTDIESWQVDETGGGTVEVYYDYVQVYTDRTVEIKTTNTNNAQLEKLDIINPISNFVNITFGFNISAYTANGNVFSIGVIDDSTGFYFVEIRVKREVGVLNAYYVSSGGGNVLIHAGLNIDDYYEFNVFINHEINRANYILYENGIVIEYIFNTQFKLIVFPYLVSGIQFSCIAPAGGDLNVAIDYCGIFDNGESHVPYPDSYGYLIIPLMKKVNIQHNNLFTINASGNVSLDIFSGFTAFTPYRTGINYSVISTFKQYVGDSRFSNAYWRTPTYDYSTLVFTFSGNINNLFNIDIEGNKLVQGVNEYWGEYAKGIQTNFDLSYFYVDEDGKLQFTLTTGLGSSEYIQADFDIANVDSTDRGISFRGYRLNKAYGYFVVDYLVGISTIDIPIIEKTTRAILPQNKTVDKLIVLITDNDQDVITGTTTGYVSQPRLISILSGISIVTAGLIEMMIPLVLIIVPTLLISKGFGIDGKKLIIPLFIVFSLIATITQIIPVWIFFVIAFGGGLFLFRNKRMED